jgi:hypothetical protein
MFRMTAKWFPVALIAAGLAACDESTVSLPEPTTIAAAAAELRLTVGDVTTLPTQVLDQNGQPIRGLQPGFASDNPSVVSVDGAGNVRAVSPGTANITSSYGSVTATTKVTVTRNERNFVHTLDLSADSVVTDVRGGTPVVSIRAFNGFGQQVCPAVTVQVDDRSVVYVTADGCRLTIFPRFAGRTTVTVSADGVSDTFAVVVSSSDARAFFSARPTAAELVAGNTVSYSVRVVDEQGNPLADRTVNLDVSAGRLSATRATTNAEGVATVQWVLPTNLRDLGSTQSIRFSTQLPNGEVITSGEGSFINGGPVVSLTLLLREDFGSGTRFVPITDPTISARLFQTVYLAARGEDQYGNPRVTDITFTVTAPAYKLCGDSQDWNGIESTCIISSFPVTATFTATVPATGSTAAISKSVNVIFAN